MTGDDEELNALLEDLDRETAAADPDRAVEQARHAAGGVVQAVSLAYLTHISGETFAESIRHGQTWGDGGMQAALIRQFDLTSRTEFLQQFARQAVQEVSNRILHGGSKPQEHPASRS